MEPNLSLDNVTDDDLDEGEEFSQFDQDDDFQDDEDINFDQMAAYANLPPLDPWRKVRRELLKAINQTREQEVGGMKQIHIDWMANEGLSQYTKLVLDEQQDDERVQQFITNGKGVGKYTACTGVTILQQEIVQAKHLIEPFLDAHGLISELYRETMLSQDYSHIGIGLGVSGKRLVLVYAFAGKALIIQQIGKTEDGKLFVKGKMLRSDIGIYAARVASVASLTEKIIVGPQAILFNNSSSEFTIHIDYQQSFQQDAEGKGANYIQLYVRGNPDTIPYGEPTDSRINIKHVELVQRMRVEVHPDPRHLYEQSKQQEKKDIQLKKKKAQQQEIQERQALEHQQRLKAREAVRIQLLEIEKQRPYEDPVASAASVASSKIHQQRSGMSSVSNITPQQRRSSISSMKGSDQQSKISLESEEEVSQHQIREELLEAIQKAFQTQKMIKQDNSQYEKRVVAIRQKLGNIHEKSSEDSMTLHKYLNTLANVHQVQFKIGEVQETYNNWAQIYQESIIDKKEKCKEIQEYFRNFKRDVAGGAEFARTGKPIPKRFIEEWEAVEQDKDKALEHVRIENISLKNRHLKLVEQGKQKEKLAEGLQLIDYEQLKIEKQTLNEKIQERNEQLHKLRKKIQTTVQILTHTKEKLKFVVAQKTKRQVIRDQKVKTLGTQRKELHDLKEIQEKIRAEYMKHKQETGIVNSNELNNDLSHRKRKVAELKESLLALEKEFGNIQINIAKAKTLSQIISTWKHTVRLVHIGFVCTRSFFSIFKLNFFIVPVEDED